MDKKRYGLFTAIAMIIGTVIGSGIFFKSDNILYYTRGDVWLGVVILIVSAFAIVFGCLTLNNLQKHSKTSGGIEAYASEFCGDRTASAFGWFFTFIYYPTLAVIISWVVGIYSCILLEIRGTQSIQLGIGFFYLMFCCIYNLVMPRFAGFFQRVSTVIKLIPLMIIALFGLILGKGVPPDPGIILPEPSTLSWIAAIGPIAFAFDGWIVVTSITSELKSPKRSLGVALIISPIFILLVYVSYFLGISKLIGTETLMIMGDSHVDLAASMIFGVVRAKLLMLGILMSVMGTLNGVVMAGIRAPRSLAIKGLLPLSRTIGLVSERYGMPVNSGVFFMLVSLAWYGIHAITLTYSLLPYSDISEISIVVQYLLFVVLYIKVFSLYRKRVITNFWNGLVFPLLAITGSFIILVGGLQNPLAPLYAAFCLLIMMLGYIYSRNNGVKH